MTVTTGAAFIPEIWSLEVIEAVKSKLVLANLVWRFDKDVMKFGDTVHVPSVSNLVANDKVAGVDVQPQAPTESTVDISINKHKESSFYVEDILAAQANRDLMKAYTESASYAIAKAIDSDIAALSTGFSNSFGTYNTAITTDVVLDSIEQLDGGDVPEDDRHFVFRPDVKRDLLDLSTYTSKDFVSGSAVETGKIGDLYGVSTYMSNNVLKSGTSTSNMLFHRHALGLAMQKKPRVQSEYQLKPLANLVVVDSVYGVLEMRDSFGVLVKT